MQCGGFQAQTFRMLDEGKEPFKADNDKNPGTG